MRLLYIAAHSQRMSSSPAPSLCTVVAVDHRSPHFEAIRKLWRRNSATLGFFPEGAFADCAHREMLLAAVGADEFLGYAAYRVSRERAMLIHLCVEEKARGKNVARTLVEHLKRVTSAQGLRGIGLSCRADFTVDGLWPRLGFLPRREKAGRSKSGTVLKFWWFDHGLPDLFSVAAATDTRIQAAIDANVFYDLHSDRPHGEESRALEADWLQPEIELCIADEIYAEIDRNDDPSDREAKRRLVEDFRLLRPDDQQREKASAIVLAILGEGTTPNEKSDRAHLVKAAAAGAAVFLTRDVEILEKAEEIRARLNIRVMAPLDLITELDAIQRQPAYQPAKMCESRILQRRVTGPEVDIMQAQLCAPNERLTTLKNTIRALVASPTDNDVYQVVDDGARLAVFAFRREGSALRVPLLRVLASPLQETLAHHLSLRVVEEARRRDLPWIKITDQSLSPCVAAALASAGFGRSEEGYWRISSKAFGEASAVLSEIAALARLGGESASAAGKVLETLREGLETDRLTAASKIEQHFWPAKVMDAGISSWIVPIQRKWAQDLVDPSLAKQELFGSDPLRALNREHVYYRAERGGPTVPGRVLWYVSKDGHDDGTMHIRACSRVVAVRTGPARVLFKENEHLGVFIWPNIHDLAGGDRDAHVMAFRFADTELFTEPIPLGEAKRAGLRSNLPSPVSISDELFATIYRRGMAMA